MSKFFEDDPRCAFCGIILIERERDYQRETNTPGACFAHTTNVLEESEEQHSMWPDHFFGHWYMNVEGVWIYSPIG